MTVVTADRDGLPWFELLGPLRAFRAAGPHGRAEVRLGGPRQQAVLVALLLRAGHVVTRDEVIDAVWGADPPATSVNNVHVYIAALRKALEPGRGPSEPGRVLATASSGYVLHVQPGHLDYELAEQHVATARRARAVGDLRAAARSLDAAVALWRGVPLAGVPGPLAEIERTRLAELRLALTEDRAETMLALGDATHLTGQLASLVAEHPFRERLAGLLMRALYQAGRKAEALAVYRSARQSLARELGVEPGTSLRRVHDDILNDREPFFELAAGPGLVQETGTVPQQLPAAPRPFIGREQELKSLADLAREAVTGPKVVIAAIVGAAGIGKSALAVQFAHVVASQFGDGQLYANMRGFGTDDARMSPQDVIDGVLDAFSVEPARVPADPRSQADLYRSVLAGKSVVLLLDNVADESQVRPLLPGGGGCLVIVTSRNRLAGLAAEHGATLITLDTLGDDEAHELLAHRLGQRRVSAEPEAVAEMAALCARLPLALSIAAARAAGRPRLPLSALVADLRDEKLRLDVLDAGEPANDVRSTLSLSYKAISAPAARMFRLLGVHPGPDITIPAAASLVATTAGQARRALDELDREHLISEQKPGRFIFHDLLRAYAAWRAEIDDVAAEREAAVERLLDHYLQTARHAAMLLHPGREPPPAPPVQRGVVPEDLADDDEAQAWFDGEHAVLLECVALAAREGHDRQAWQLPWCLVTYLYRRGHWDQWAATQRVALDAAQRSGDLTGQARAHLDLGYIGVVTGSTEDVRGHLDQALRMFGQLNDSAGQARAHNALAGLLEGQQRYSEALHHARLSLDLYLATDNRPAQATALTEVAWLLALLGDHERAIHEGARSLALQRESGSPHGVASAMETLGFAHSRAGLHAAALDHYQPALAIRRQLGDRQHEAGALEGIGDTYRALGREAEAREAWLRAAAILEDLHHPDAGKVRAKLGQADLALPSSLLLARSSSLALPRSLFLPRSSFLALVSWTRAPPSTRPGG